MSGDDLGHWPADLSASVVEDFFGNVIAPPSGQSGGAGWPSHRARASHALPALTASMRVETPGGRKRADELVPGELVLTRDRGYQHLCWRVQVAPAAIHPVLRSPMSMIRIAAGALGERLPAQDVIVSPSQRIMLAHARAEALFGADEVLAAAGDLLHIDGVDLVDDNAEEHISLLFDSHEVVLVEGLWTESLLPGPGILEALPADQRAALRTAQPRLCHATGHAAYMPSRMVLNAREARLLTML